MPYAEPIKNECIHYRVPLYEIERARQGVPMEQLDKVTKPKVIKPCSIQFEFYRSKKRKNGDQFSD